MEQEFRYYQCDGYFILDIQLSPYKHKMLGKYGRMRRAYLQGKDLILLNDLILSEMLFPHLWESDETAHRRVEQLMIDSLEKDSALDKVTQQMA